MTHSIRDDGYYNMTHQFILAQQIISEHLGKTAELPCPVNTESCGALHSINWFKGDTRIAAVLLDDSNITSVSEGYKDRVIVEQSPFKLIIKDLQISDEDIYLCDTTFFIPLEACDNYNGYRVKLNVLVPPTEVVIIDEKGDRIENGTVLGPLQEGHTLRSTCIVKKTRPQPSVGWFRGNKRLTTHSPTYDEKDGLYTATLELSLVLSRLDLNSTIECRVESSAIQGTIRSAIHIDMQVRPTGITLSGVEHHTVQGSKVVLTCHVYGARPAVNISWSNSSVPILDKENALTEIRTQENEENDGTFHTRSELVFNASRFENDMVFRCDADNVVLQMNREKPIYSFVTLEVMYPPVVKVSPPHITVNTSDTVLLNCEYVANPATLTSVKCYEVIVEQSPFKLIIKDLQISDEDIYLCDTTFFIPLEACDNYNGYRVKLNVLVPPTEVVIIDEKGDRIENGTVLGPLQEGHTLRSTCIVKKTRPQPSVGWFRGNKRLTTHSPTYDEKDGLYTATLELSLVLSRLDLNSTIECRVESSAIQGTIRSAIHIDMQVRPTGITLSGVEHHTVQGSKVVLTCHVYGARPAVNISWSNSSVPILDKENALTEIRTQENEENDGTFHTRSELVFNASRFENDMVFRCDADNVVLQMNREKPIYSFVTLEVMYPPVVKVSPPHITVNTSDTVLLNCEYVANPATLTSVKWYRNTDLVNVNDTDRYEGGNSENVALVIKSTDKRDIGNYSCHLSNSITTGKGVSETQIELDVQYVPIVEVLMTPEGPVKESDESNVTLYCNVVDANPSQLTKVRWYANSSLLKELPDCSETNEDLCHIDPSKLLLESIGRGFFYNYSCEGFNAAGWGPRSDDKELMVHYEPGQATLTHFPLIAVKKKSVSFSCSVDDPGYPESNRFRWFRGGRGPLQDVVTKDWTVEPVGLDSRTNYSCYAYNEGGHGVPATVNLEVHAPPFFIKNLFPYTGIVYSSRNASLMCRIECVPRCTISWYKDGIALEPDNERYFVKEEYMAASPATGDFESVMSVLHFNMTAWPNKRFDIDVDSANYSCVSSSNAVGPGIKSATYFSIEYAPENTTVTDEVVHVLEGNIPGRVVCKSKANPEPSYEWRFNNKTINRGSTLIINNPMSRNDTGRYTCAAFNKHGSSVSDTFIDVQFKPKCEIERREIDDKDTLICTAFGNPIEADFSWSIKAENDSVEHLSNSKIKGEKSFYILDEDYAIARTYRCVANNSVGAGTFCEIEVAEQLAWWQRWDKTTLIILVAAVLALLLAVIIICCIIICICRRRRRQDKYEMSRPVVPPPLPPRNPRLLKNSVNSTNLLTNVSATSANELLPKPTNNETECHETSPPSDEDEESPIQMTHANNSESAASVSAAVKIVRGSGFLDRFATLGDIFKRRKDDDRTRDSQRSHVGLLNSMLNAPKAFWRQKDDSNPFSSEHRLKGIRCSGSVTYKKTPTLTRSSATTVAASEAAPSDGDVVATTTSSVSDPAQPKTQTMANEIHDKSSSLGDPLTEPGEYENLPFHGLQTAPNKFITTPTNFNNNTNVVRVAPRPKRLLTSNHDIASNQQQDQLTHHQYHSNIQNHQLQQLQNQQSQQQQSYNTIEYNRSCNPSLNNTIKSTRSSAAIMDSNSLGIPPPPPDHQYHPQNGPQQQQQQQLTYSLNNCFPKSYTEYYHQQQQQKFSTSNSQLLNSIEHNYPYTVVERGTAASVTGTSSNAVAINNNGNNPFLAAGDFKKFDTSTGGSMHRTKRSKGHASNNGGSTIGGNGSGMPEGEKKFYSLKFPGNKKSHHHLNSIKPVASGSIGVPIIGGAANKCKRHHSFAGAGDGDVGGGGGVGGGAVPPPTYATPMQSKMRFYEPPVYENLNDSIQIHECQVDTHHVPASQLQQKERLASNPQLQQMQQQHHHKKRHHQHMHQKKVDDFNLIEPERLSIYRSDSGISNSSYECVTPVPAPRVGSGATIVSATGKTQTSRNATPLSHTTPVYMNVDGTAVGSNGGGGGGNSTSPFESPSSQNDPSADPTSASSCQSSYSATNRCSRHPQGLSGLVGSGSSHQEATTPEDGSSSATTTTTTVNGNTTSSSGKCKRRTPSSCSASLQSLEVCIFTKPLAASNFDDELEYADMDFHNYGPINYKAASVYALVKKDKKTGALNSVKK
ncbi:uncharacterized protein LOC129951381 [Eupeodes corollae]|uniref:uncharacterized protein LOC129951381 n=1 Tax=Eupeodes corollae TaxID=290404 RepID=UPI0024903B91|nr:uncharacterized protein LOC129951381 [Eupeodes corollae]